MSSDGRDLRDESRGSQRLEAVALAYGSGEDAPRVVARGYGLMAERIIEEARRHGVFVHDAPELVDLLMQLDLDQRIPLSLYQAIAELLAWVHSVRGSSPEPQPPVAEFQDTSDPG